MENSSRIYVSGHKGLVGSALVRGLAAQGCPNLILRSSRELDLRRQGDVEGFFREEKPDYVFLAAAKVGGILANSTYPAEFIYDNLTIETNIIHSAFLSGARKLIFLGSSCIYPKHCPQPMKEEHLLTGALEPTNEPYALAKIAGIKMCQSYNHQYGTNFVSVMPTNLFGPGDNFDLETSHVLPALLRKFHLARLAVRKDRAKIEEDESRFGRIPADIRQSLGIPAGECTLGDSPAKIIIWGTGRPRREFLHVDDLADACIFIMKEIDAVSSPSGDSGIINIGCGKDCTIQELAELVRRVTGFEGELVYDSTKPDGTPRKLLDVTRLERLGWKPRIGLEEGIRQTYEWYCRQAT
ncbi:MAG: GDP-L-fucose synthase [Pseudomonadota bacterium]